MERTKNLAADRKLLSIAELLHQKQRQERQPNPLSTQQVNTPDEIDSNKVERLFEETNILEIEGRLFCFDPREARRRHGKIQFGEADTEHQMVIEIHPSYGQPSVLAFRVLQAIFKKVTDEGLPAADTVSFTQRELARLAGRQSFGGKQSKELFHALMQLHRTGISAAFVEKGKQKDTRRWVRLDFLVITRLLTSGRGKEITECVVQLEPKIVESLNNRHWTCFNWDRLQGLEPIGAAIYKRLYRHFSNLYQPDKGTGLELRFEKDYSAILGEWLGGLATEQYASRVKQQLGSHLDQLVQSGLLRKWAVSKKANLKGLKLTFWPGKGFFQDYQRFYQEGRPTRRLGQIGDYRSIQQPHELAAYFHQKRGNLISHLNTREVAFASLLLDRYSYNDVRDLIDYSIGRAKQTHFEMRYFTAIKQYVPEWQRELARA